MEILELKEQLEKAINERLSQFKNSCDRYENLSAQLELEHNLMIRIALELKDVEYIIRASGNDAHADLVDLLLDGNKKVENGKQVLEKVPLFKNKKR